MNFKNISLEKKSILYFLITALALFLIIFPLSNQIDFQQNDDYAYYKMLNFFMQRNFFLIQETSASFYTQGIISLPFAYIFGIKKMPVFTLLISVLNFFLISYITYKYFIKKFWDSLIIGLIFFFNPLHFYSIFGYMTENYFTLFLLLIILFFNKFEENPSKLNFIILNLTIFAGFMLRQFSMLAGLALGIYFIYQRKYKLGLVQLLIFSLIFGYYQFIFPQTPDMKDTGDRNFMLYIEDPSRIYNTLIAFLLYFSAFCFPLIPALIKNVKNLKNYTFIGITAVSLIGIFVLFSSGKRVSDTIFYLRNTVAQNGFIFTSRLGDVAPIDFGVPFFQTWDIVAKLFLAFLIGLISFYYKKIITFYSIFIAVYLSLILTFTSIYDRYALPLIIFGIFALLSMSENGLNKISKYLAIFYLVAVISFNYQASMRFVLANKLLWNRAYQLTKEKDLSKNRMLAGYPWFLLYPIRDEYVFIFTFNKENKEINQSKFTLVETHSINFPFSAYKSNEVYIYQRNTYLNR